jgi:2-methylcitrate dehydratase PrpD
LTDRIEELGLGTTEDLARWLVDCRPGDIPADTVHEARRALVNIVGCALGGARHEAVDLTIAAFGPMFGPPAAAVLGRTERADPLHAALLNGISSHVEDFDDTLPANYIHASSPVASALLAYASACGDPVSGRDLLHAFVLGFEVTSRLGNATYPSHYRAGWHSTGSVGVFGAAVAIGTLLRLDAQRMVWAIGLAGTQAAGVREQFGSMGKALHPGRAAQSGYGAALLAAKGFTSGAHGIEGPRGWASVTAAEHDLAKVTDRLGETWELHVNTYKPFPCGIVNHPAIDACIQLHDEHAVRPQDVRQVRLHVAPLVIDLCGKTDIHTGLEGKFSVVHGAAVGLVRGRAGLREYTDEAVTDPDVRHVRERTTRAADDPEVTEDGVRVEVELTDGRVLAKRLEGSLGNLRRPLSDEQLDAKFRDQATLALPQVQAERALALCRRADELADVRELVDATIPAG